MSVEIRVRPPGKVLREFYRSRSRICFIRGPLGSAKTTTTIQKIFRLMCEQKPNAEGIRPSRWVAVRNTYPDLTTTTIRDWLEFLGDLGGFNAQPPPEHKLEFMLPDGTTVKAEMLFLSLDRPEDIRKLRGTQVTGFWFNEVKELSKAVIDFADLRHGRYPSKAMGGVTCTWHGMLGDTNAPDEDHWYAEYEEEPPDEWEFHIQPGGVIWDPTNEVWRENPMAENLKNLPRGYYIKGMAGKTHDWIKVNLGNEFGFVIDGRPVFPSFSQHVHMAREPIELVPKLSLMIGMDFGLTPAAVLGQRLPDGRWNIIDELVTFDTGVSRFADAFKAQVATLWPGVPVAGWGDPSGDIRAGTDENTCFNILQAKGIPCSPAPSNDPVIREESVNACLNRMVDGKPGIQVSPRCKVLRRALAGGYHYRRVQIQVDPPKYAEKPDKNEYSHVAEALEYLLLGAGEGRSLLTPETPVELNPLVWAAWNGG